MEGGREGRRERGEEGRERGREGEEVERKGDRKGGSEGGSEGGRERKGGKKLMRSLLGDRPYLSEGARSYGGSFAAREGETRNWHASDEGRGWREGRAWWAGRGRLQTGILAKSWVN